MGVNHVTTADGEELINLMSDTVNENNLLEDETAHAANGEAIVGKAKYINPNLLINPDFSINQRGFAGGDLHPYNYSVDGWCVGNVASHIAFDGDKVTIKHTGTNGYATYGQVVEQLKAGTYTVSADIISADSTIDGIIVRIATKDNVTFVSAKTLCKPTTGFVPGRYSYTFEVADDIEGVLVYWYSYITGAPNGEAFVIAKPKLEPGMIATPFVKPNPAVELVKCQWFFERIYIPLNKQLIANMYSGLNHCSYNITYTKKRTTPTIVPQYFGRFVNPITQSTPLLETFVPETVTDEFASIQATWSAAEAFAERVIGWVDTLGYIDVSAEL